MSRRTFLVIALAALPVAAAQAAAPGPSAFRVSTAAGTTSVHVIGTAGADVATVELAGAFRRPAVVPGLLEGVSHDRGTLVLTARRGPSTTFAVLSRRAAWRPQLVRLAPRFAYDALSPDGRLLYLTEHLARPAGHYRVRVLDLAAGRLRDEVVADKSRAESPMAGTAVARATTAGGRWVFTLYQGGHHGPFVHALATPRAVAVCLDLRPEAPAHRTTDALWELVPADGGRSLRAVNEATGEARMIDLRGPWPELRG